MKKLVSSLLLTFYSIGILFLPLGDFSNLVDLPSMYQHCKATEDKDMTAIDFLTDHLVNIDCFFDNHDKGDKQKPHSPIQIQHNDETIVSIFVIYNVFFFPRTSIKVNLTSITSFHLPKGYSFKIFRPPIV